MADIFLSYQSADRERAKQVAKALEDVGWSVFWDRKIKPGETWPDYIKRKLDEAACVVTLWSSAARESKWVRRESRYGQKKGILVPGLIEDVEPPFEFDDVHAADLVDWDGSREADAFRELVRGIEDKVQVPSQPDLLTEAPKREEPEVILQGLRQRLASAPALRELRRLEHEAAEHSKRHPSADATEFLKVVQAALHLEEALQER